MNRNQFMSQFKIIEKEVRSIFSMLRKESIASEDYKVILFLLSLVKDEVLSKDHHENINDITVLVDRRLEASSQELQNVYLPIYDEFRPSLRRFGTDAAFLVLRMLLGYRKGFIAKYFLKLFDEILFNITRSRGSVESEYVQPWEVTKFIESIIEVPKNASVFNPFAGLGSFGLFLNGGHEYFGQEIDKKVWALGVLRIRGHKHAHRAEFNCLDSLENWPKDKRFDLIVSNLPSRLKVDDALQKFSKKYDSVEMFFLNTGLKALNPNGKLVALLPADFLSRGVGSQELKRQLIENDLIDTIIQLPLRLFSYTRRAMTIVVLDKKKQLPGKIRFVNAQSFIQSHGSRIETFDNRALTSFFKSGYKESKYVKLIDNDLVSNSNYSLNTLKYFLKKVEGVQLKSILEFIAPIEGEIPDASKYASSEDLKSDKLDLTINHLNIGSFESSIRYRYSNKKRRIWKLDESCLLVSWRSISLNPTYFEFSGQPIYLDILSGIMPFRINDEIVDRSFLLYELSAEYIEEQRRACNYGAIIGSISSDDFLDIVIKLPSIVEQRAKVQGINELSSKIRVLQNELVALEQGKELNSFNEFASLKHTLGAPRQNILDWADNLFHFLKEGPTGFISLNAAFKEFYELDMLEALAEIKSDVSFMTEVLEKGENGFKMKDYENTITSLAAINKHFNSLSGNGFKFKLKKTLLSKKTELKSRGIEVNEILLKTLVDNILLNAHKHGFDTYRQGNEVNIELKELDDFLSIEIRNNGKPFPRNFDRNKFITKFSTADTTIGSGLGGYDIDRIACHFNNPDWELVLNEDLIFTVKFIFKIPIKHMI